MSKWFCGIGRRKRAVINSWDCSHSGLEDLPKEVWERRTSIRCLNMSSNCIRDLPKTLFQLQRLEELDISENEILFLPPSISKLEYLTSLNLSKNSLSTIPDSIMECHSLLNLDLSSNPLGEMCDGITELRQLRKLVLNDIQMEDLPPSVGKLEKLEILEVRENMLQSLPGSIAHLSLLERLDLGVNEFVNLPSTIGSLESLSELWLDTNTISVLPEEMGNLHNLRFLEVSENHLMMMPESMGGWTSLTHLYLGENLLTHIPASVGELNKLTVLRLENNRFGGLPDTLDGLYSVTEFSLAHNHISELPPSIGGMTSLINLNLDENLLSYLPAEIGLCSSLSILSIRNNQLMELPPEIASLHHLSILSLAGNQLQHLPYTLMNLNNITAIWLAENQSRPIVDLQLTRDERGEKCLTCFLFPQQGPEPPYSEGTSPLDSITEENFYLQRTSQVNFDTKVLDNLKKGSKISRDPTPFPKELHSKAMQWRASRDIVLGEGTVKAEGGVMLRHGVKGLHSQNRNSLLTALANPLNEYLPMLDKPESGETKSRGRRERQTRSGSRDSSSPHPHTIMESIEESKLSVKMSQTSFNQSISPLPPPIFSPDGSIVNTVQSGPYLDPPREFASSFHSGTGNGNVSFGMGTDMHQISENTGHYSTSSMDATDGEQPSPVKINNNNNNNNNNNSQQVASYSTVLKTNKISSRISNRQYFPSHSHSHKDLQPVMEAEFIANGEKNTQPWYTSSPESSPETRINSEHSKQSLNRVVVIPEIKKPSELTAITPMTATTSVSRSPKQNLLSRGPVSSDYDHLPCHNQEDKKRSDLVGGAQSSPHANHRMTSQPCTRGGGGVVTSQGYCNCCLPKDHPGSCSFDHRYTSTPPPTRIPSKDCTHSHKQNFGFPLSSPSKSPNQHFYHQRSPIVSTRPHVAVQNKSLTPPLASPISNPPGSNSKSSGCGTFPSGKHAHSEREASPWYKNGTQHSRKGEHNEQMHGIRNIDIRGLSNQVTRHTDKEFSRYTDEKSDYRSQGKVGIGEVTFPSKEQQLSDDVLCSEAVGNNRSRGQPDWMNGHDSGVEGRKIKIFSPIANHSNLASKGSLIQVVLQKDPSLGLGITGGRGGENAIQPGNKGFHVYKVMDGLPAQRSGKINIGDRLVQVNGVEVSNLTHHEVLALLTGPEKTFSLVLHREASMTLI